MTRTTKDKQGRTTTKTTTRWPRRNQRHTLRARAPCDAGVLRAGAARSEPVCARAPLRTSLRVRARARVRTRVESGRALRKARAGQRGDKEGCGTDRAQASAEATYADIIFGIQASSSTYEGAINLSPPPPKTATTTTARLLPPSLRARTSQHPFPRAYLPRRSVHLLCQPASQSPCPAGCQPASPPSSQPASMPGNKPASLFHLRPPS